MCLFLVYNSSLIPLIKFEIISFNCFIHKLIFILFIILLVPNSLYLEKVRPLQASVLRSWGENNTERTVAVTIAIAIAAVEAEHARTGRIATVAPA